MVQASPNDVERYKSLANEVLFSDPLSERSRRAPGVSLEDELERLNRAFIENRRSRIGPADPPVDYHLGADDDSDEDWPSRAFAADSLHPPSSKKTKLNTYPLYEILENQNSPPPGIAAADWAWGPGNPHRTAGEASAEYWGDDGNLAPRIGAMCPIGAPPRRYMRRPDIPFWQIAGDRDHERDIEETLGTATREIDSQIRGWDAACMLLRHRNGGEPSRLGPQWQELD